MTRSIAAHVQQAVEQRFGSEGGKKKSCAKSYAFGSAEFN